MSNQSKLIPVFILGAGRSGTKFLRDILDASSNVSVIPFDVGYIWRYGNENVPHDELTPDMLTDSIKDYVKKTLPTLTDNDSSLKERSFIIEKSVPNTLRPLFLHAIYPDAKFIHLIRDGRAVTESAMRVWQTPLDKYYLLNKLRYFPLKNYRYAIWYFFNMLKGKLFSNHGLKIWGPRYKGIDIDAKELPLEVICARQWKCCVETSLLQLSEINQNNIIEIRYENLMSSSAAVLQICDFLGLLDIDDIVANYENQVVRFYDDKWKKSLDKSQLQLINKEIESLNYQLGYS